MNTTNTPFVVSEPTPTTFQPNQYNDKEIKEILKISYLNPKGANKQLTNLGLTYLPEFSDVENKVFLDKQGKANIAFRGTKKSKIADLVSDASIIFGMEKYNPRFKKSKDLVKRVEQKYGSVNVFGDSLGGALARRSESSGSVFMHNPALGWHDIGTTVKKHEYIMKNKGDAVSVVADTLKNPHGNIKRKTVRGNPHKIVL